MWAFFKDHETQLLLSHMNVADVNDDNKFQKSIYDISGDINFQK